MIPCSSPRSSGWRATDWIIEPKMYPMPMPAPTEPRPMPSASATALPASTAVSAWARTGSNMGKASLVFGLDGRADVDGRQGGEDERLDAHDDHDLEEVEERRESDDERREDEHQPAHEEDQADEGED